MVSTYKLVVDFKNKYSGSISWRLKKHCKIVDQNLYDGENVLFAFAGQNNNSHSQIFDTAVFALTDQRIIIAQDNIIGGYNLSSITPDLYNDLQVYSGIAWGMITIDTVKETVYFSNLSKKSLSEIQKNVSSFMIEAKKKYYSKEKEKDSN